MEEFTYEGFAFEAHFSAFFGCGRERVDGFIDNFNALHDGQHGLHFLWGELNGDLGPQFRGKVFENVLFKSSDHATFSHEVG
tara:strand:- start:186 stop:431 length:246 start_codon:yes stop_codon:yes gene_type:complete